MGKGTKQKSVAMGRRKFIQVAATTAAATGSLAQLVGAQQKEPSSRPSEGTRPASRPALPSLGNAEPPAMQFQAYYGGTGALMEKLVRQHGPAAFDRALIEPEPWTGDVPKAEEDVAFLPVYRLAGLIKARHISPSELTGIYLERLKRLDPVLLCAVTILEGPAKEAAQQADAEIKSGKYRGPLHGIPWGLKDLFSIKGAPTTWGAKEFKDRVMDEDAELAVRLRDAGAILIAKLSTGRFAINDQWFRGRTNNPWNLKQGSSGSSAGVASATAAGCVAFGIGTETRGSIVSPTVRCGLCALRPTYGRVSRHGGMVLAWTMDRAGPICRASEDCALVFNAIHGLDEKDASTLTSPFRYERKPDLSKIRIGYDNRAPQPFVDKLRELGADPKPIGPRPGTRGIDTIEPESTAAFDCFLSTGIVKDEDSPNGTPGSGRFTRGRTWSALDFIQSQRRRGVLVRKMAELMKDFDMYVSGSGDVELCSYTGNPAAVLPYTFREGDNGQPVCTTIIGDVFADDKILSVANAYQRATDWHLKRPKVGT
jgi:Asp-tRNA(Asn)/Glu-tRNA(Gln) amidotransferase A subunit family amidase